MLRITLPFVLSALFLPLTAGCGPQAAPPAGGQSAGGRTAGDSEHGHAHDELGPHGGHLIELGRDHLYHAELMHHDGDGQVTIHLLDGKLGPSSTDESSLTLIVAAGAETTSFTLAGVEENGRYPRFRSTDPALIEQLDAPRTTSLTVRVTIDGTPYVGRLEHNDAEHGHSH